MRDHNRGVEMAELMAVYRIMPEEPGAEQNIKEALAKIKNASLKEVRVEPFAFGLNAVIAAFLMQEQEGLAEKLEEEIKGIAKVSDVRLEHVSRI
mgnify:CR=1 FL=1